LGFLQFEGVATPKKDQGNLHLCGIYKVKRREYAPSGGKTRRFSMKRGYYIKVVVLGPGVNTKSEFGNTLT